MTESDKNLITALRTAKSRSRRMLFDAAADRLEELLTENNRLSAQLWAAEIAANEYKELAREKFTNTEEEK